MSGAAGARLRGPVRFLCRNEIRMRLKINKSPVSGRGSCGARVAGDFFVGEVRGARRGGGAQYVGARAQGRRRPAGPCSGAQRRRPAGRRRTEPPDSPALRATATLRF